MLRSRRRPLARALAVLPVALVLPLGAAAPASAASCAAANVAPSADRAASAVATLCLLNQERARHGLRPLRANAKLARSATRYSRDMARRNFFSHVSPGGSTMLGRIRRAGYLTGARSYSVGENLAWGSGSHATPAQTVRNWMNSPGHRANILNGRFREIGVGIAIGAPVHLRGHHPGAGTYTTHFGARS